MVAVLALLGPGVVAPPAYADTVRQLQWHLDTLQISAAHRIIRGEGVVVGVLDTGVYAAHPDLQGQVLPGHGIGADAPADGRDDADRGTSHGTGMAGIIAGRGGGDMRLLGIAPAAKILPVSTGVEQTSAETPDAIRWAVDNGAKVINLSVAGRHAATPAETTAVGYALERDVVVVAGAGNVEVTGPGVGSPALIPGVLAVSGTDRAGALWSGSSRGPEVGIAAPAVRIIFPATPSSSGNGYLLGDGTSAATAIVSGIAALVRARYPQLSAANVVNRLIRTAKDAGPPGRDAQFGFGIVNPVAALTADVAPVAANPLITAAPGATAASASPPDSRQATGPPVAITEVRWPVIGGCLAVLAAAVVVLIVLSRRRRVVSATRRPPYGQPQAYGQPGAYDPAPPHPPPAPGPAPPAYGPPPAGTQDPPHPG